MSRIGKLPIKIPAGVKVDINGQDVTVQGPRGSLSRTVMPDMNLALEDGTLVVTRPTDLRHHRAQHGLTRALLNNMVTGVSSGFRKMLVVDGVGYRAELQGSELVLFLGYSHPINVPQPPGITFTVDPKARTIVVEGSDAEMVGQVAADLRKLRPPEPYKGKGIRYSDEKIRRKAGKAGKTAKSGK